MELLDRSMRNHKVDMQGIHCCKNTSGVLPVQCVVILMWVVYGEDVIRVERVLTIIFQVYQGGVMDISMEYKDGLERYCS